MSNISIELLEAPLEIQTCLDFVQDPTVGGIDIFVGTVRNHTSGKQVEKLHFESYAPMAIKEMQKIAEAACEKWPLKSALIHHRVGTLDIGEIPVIIATSSAHRVAAFESCQYIIDTLKETVPIWKKEFFENGEIWVAAHP